MYNPSQRPVIKPPRTHPDYIGEGLALVGALTGLMLLVYIWTDLPGEIPRHFGFSGEPTAWSGRWSTIGAIATSVVLYTGMTFLGRFPHKFNYPFAITEQNAAIQYRLGRSMIIWLKVLCTWMFVVIVWSQARVALGDTDRFNPLLIIGFLVAIHVAMGVFLYRMVRHQHGNPDDDPSAARSTDLQNH